MNKNIELKIKELEKENKKLKKENKLFKKEIKNLEKKYDNEIYKNLYEKVNKLKDYIINSDYDDIINDYFKKNYYDLAYYKDKEITIDYYYILDNIDFCELFNENKELFNNNYFKNYCNFCNQDEALKFFDSILSKLDNVNSYLYEQLENFIENEFNYEYVFEDYIRKKYFDFEDSFELYNEIKNYIDFNELINLFLEKKKTKDKNTDDYVIIDNITNDILLKSNDINNYLDNQYLKYIEKYINIYYDEECLNIIDDYIKENNNIDENDKFDFFDDLDYNKFIKYINKDNNLIKLFFELRNIKNKKIRYNHFKEFILNPTNIINIKKCFDKQYKKYKNKKIKKNKLKKIKN